MRARTGLWEPWAGDDPWPPGPHAMHFPTVVADHGTIIPAISHSAIGPNELAPFPLPGARTSPTLVTLLMLRLRSEVHEISPFARGIKHLHYSLARTMISDLAVAVFPGLIANPHHEGKRSGLHISGNLKLYLNDSFFVHRPFTLNPFSDGNNWS